MSTIERDAAPGLSRAAVALLLGIVPLCALALAIAAARQPLLAVALALGGCAALAMLLRSEVAALAGLVLLFTNAPVVAVEFHGVPFIAGAAIVPLLLALPVFEAVLLRREEVVLTPALPLVGLFVAVQFLGLAVAERAELALRPAITSLAEGLVLYFLVTNAVRTTGTLRRATWLVLLAAALLSALACHQQLTRSYDSHYAGFAQVTEATFETEEGATVREQPRLGGPIGKNNFWAQCLLMALPLGLVRIWEAESRWLRLVAALSVGLVLCGIGLTFSRGAAVGLAALVLAMALAGYFRLRHVAAVVLGAALVFYVVPEYATRLQSLERLTGLTDPAAELGTVDSSARSRLTEMVAAVWLFADHPLLGVGPGMYPFHYGDYAERVGVRLHAGNRGAHSLYLGMAAENGLLGIGAFLGILAITLVGLLKARSQTADPQLRMLINALLLSVVAFMTTGLFLSFAYERYAWTFLALAHVACRLARNETTP